MRQPVQKVALLLALSVLLTACGFQLKGSQNFGGGSLSGLRIAVISANPANELTSAVNQSIRLSGAELVGRGEAELVLQLADEQFTRRNLALTAQARAAEVELTVATRFALQRGTETLVADTQAAVTRNMLDDPRNVVGKTEEMRLLREEMRRDVADQIVRRAARSLNN